MANETTKNKFQAMIEAQLLAASKLTAQAQPAFIPVEQPEPSKLKQITIIWHEGQPVYGNTTYNTWQAINRPLRRIFEAHQADGGQGYNKVKINVKWENGHEITDRIDLSAHTGDLNPTIQTLAEYIKNQNSVMYSSTLQVGQRQSLSFEDQAPEVSDLYIDELIQPVVMIDVKDLPEPDKTEVVNGLTVHTYEIKNDIEILDYSDKAIAVIGNTKPIKEHLKNLGGKFNPFLKCGPGWIFPKTKRAAIKNII